MSFVKLFETLLFRFDMTVKFGIFTSIIKRFYKSLEIWYKLSADNSVEEVFPPKKILILKP